MTIDEFEKKLSELEDLHNELKAQIAELKARNEEPPKPPHPRWEPENGERYYYLDCDGWIESSETISSECKKYKADIGNLFNSVEEAKFAAERMKVLAEMNEWAGKNYDGAYIYYHRPSDEIMVNWDGDSTNCFGDIRFKCVDDAENCIDAVGADRIKKYYFMIPEGETNEQI